MKKSIIPIVLIILPVIILFSFISPKADITIPVDLAKSKIQWIAKKVTGKHEGFIPISSGSLVTNGKMVTGGLFDIDVTGMTDSDLTNKNDNASLISHLKEDLFETAKFPKASFSISSVSLLSGNNFEVAGKLTIKGITQDIKFPAVIITTATGINATASVKINRQKFGIRYAANFFKKIADNAINNEFELNINLVAGK